MNNNINGEINNNQSISGAVKVQIAPSPDIFVGNVATLEPGSSASVELDEKSTKLNRIFNFGIPTGPTGPTYTITENDYAAIAQLVKESYVDGNEVSY